MWREKEMLARSDRRLAVRVTTEELNMNRERVRQIVKKIWKWEKLPLTWCLESWYMARKNDGFTIYLIFYAMHRCLIGSLPVMKPDVFKTNRKQNDRTCSGKYRIHLGRKKHAYLNRKSRPCLCVSSITRW
jgi:hypothetical protein